MNGHLAILPIIVPFVAGGLILLVERGGIGLQRGIAFAATLTQLLLAIALIQAADSGVVGAYLVGDWPARLGIALAVDRLTAIMLLTTASLGCAGLLYAGGGWDRRAPHFHALFQIQLMGLNGAYLTADLFNLFVFFEVLLIASYGLMLSGGRAARMRAGLHYVAFNITASALYLIAVGLLYGLLGALNMAEMAERIAAAPAANLPLIAAAGGLLLIVFAAKAALFPLSLWLPETYARTPAPVVALFAVMTKLGVYAVLRVYSLLFGPEAGPLAGHVWPWVLGAAALGLLLASFGALAAGTLRRLAGYLTIGSAATLFLAVGLAEPGVLGAALYYLMHSAGIGAALFLLADLIRRQRLQAGDSLLALDRIGPNALLGGLFMIAAVSMVGLPPLSGFIGKFALLDAMPAAAAGWLWPLILINSLFALIAFARAGSHLFWQSGTVAAGSAALAPAPKRIEWLAVVLLLASGIGLSVAAQPVLRYTGAAAEQVLSPSGYRDALLQARAGKGDSQP